MATDKGKGGPSITLDESTVLSLVDEAKALVTQIESFKTERAALEASTLAELVLTDGEVQSTHQNYEAWLVQIEDLNKQVSEARAFIDQKVKEAIDKVHKGTDVETLRTMAIEKANRAKVIADMLGLEVEVPSIPTGSTKASSGGTRTVKAGNQRFYRVIDGEKTYQSAAQNSLSSLAWYYSEYASPDGKRMPTADFVKVLEANGWDSKVQTKSWGPIDVGLQKGKLVQVGMDVSEDKPADEAPAKDEDTK